MKNWITQTTKLVLDNWIKAMCIIAVAGVSFSGFSVGVGKCNFTKTKIKANATANKK